MQQKIILSLLANIILAGCANGNNMTPVQNTQFHSLVAIRGLAMKTDDFLKSGKTEKDAIKQAIQSLTDTLKDPDSAKFRNVRMKKYDDMHIICGEVNAKNSYGGYTGYKKFAAAPHERLIENFDGGRYPQIDAAANSGIYTVCDN